MLDSAIVQQLQSVFARLEAPLTLVRGRSDHAKQAELDEMLDQVASTSDKITIRDGEPAEVPRFSIEHDGSPTGIAFVGIPGGHEFTSLILAILNSDGKGKLPDEALLDRVRRLKGPVQLRTFVSLSCENCPDVVQALNLMASVHPAFEHSMVDGEFAQDEVERLRIQGVPSVIGNDTLISSGKATFGDLLARLEKEYGSEEASAEPRDLGLYDVAVIGGGPAGVATAIYTARKGLKTTLITDRLGGQLQDTKGIENMISVKYTEGPQLSAALNEHLSAYDIELLEHRRVERLTPGTEKGDPAELALDSGETMTANAVVIATGAKWRELGVTGEREYLGRGVAYCPHCDGPYYKGKDIAVVGGGNSGVEAAIDLAGMVKSVTLIEFAPDLKADQVLVDKLHSLTNVTVHTNAKTTVVEGDGEAVTGLTYEDLDTGTSTTVPLEGVFVQIGLVPNSAFVADYVETNAWGEIEVDAKGRTNVPGIYAAGDVTTVPYKQIVIALGDGAKAGLAAFEDQML